MNPFADILDDAALDVLTAIGSSSLAGRFYLAGGTALALHARHRRSMDLDFFHLELKEKVGFTSISAGIKTVFRTKKTVVEEKQADQVIWRINGTRVTFLAHPFGLLEPLVAGESLPCRAYLWPPYGKSP